MPYDYNSQPKKAYRKRSGREKVADAMTEEGSSMDPIEHPMQGAARMAQGYFGGKMKRKMGMGGATAKKNMGGFGLYKN